MNIHDFRIPETLAEMRQRVERVGHQVSEDASDAAMLLDQFQNGEYHEDVVQWAAIAAKLATEEIVALSLASIRHYIASEGISSDAPQMTAILTFYQALNDWAKNRLPEPTMIIESTAAFRNLLFQSPVDSRSIA